MTKENGLGNQLCASFIYYISVSLSLTIIGFGGSVYTRILGRLAQLVLASIIFDDEFHGS